MKVFNTIAKIVTALLAIAGAVYVIATYGDRIVAWAKKVFAAAEETCCCRCECDCEAVEDADEVCEAEAPDSEEESAPVAEETDFAE